MRRRNTGYVGDFHQATIDLCPPSVLIPSMDRVTSVVLATVLLDVDFNRSRYSQLLSVGVLPSTIDVFIMPLYRRSWSRLNAANNSLASRKETKLFPDATTTWGLVGHVIHRLKLCSPDARTRMANINFRLIVNLKVSTRFDVRQGIIHRDANELSLTNVQDILQLYKIIFSHFMCIVSSK